MVGERLPDGGSADAENEQGDAEGEEDIEFVKLNEWLARFGKERAETKTKAKRSLRAIYVNIVDLMQVFDRSGGNPSLQDFKDVRQFGSLRQLRDYSKKNDKIYPKKKLKAEHRELRPLLRNMYVQ
jgi:hypothetical protein